MPDQPVSSGELNRSASNQSGYYFFDERYGDHSAAYLAVDAGETPDHWPNLPARLTCDVCFTRSIWAVFRRERKTWVAPAGTYCLILGRWTDGTMRLQLGMPDTRHPDRHVTIDGRFPGWVAQEVIDRPMLRSNIRPKQRSRVTQAIAAVLALALAAAAVAMVAQRRVVLPSAVTALVIDTPENQRPDTVASSLRPTPLLTPAVAQPMAAAPTQTPITVMRVGNTGGQGVYIRRTPAMDDKVRAYPDGTTFHVIGPDQNANGVQWHHVSAPDGLIGYVPDQYVVVDAEQ
jgi:hypothetical protein